MVDYADGFAGIYLPLEVIAFKTRLYKKPEAITTISANMED
jgi:hypothetical protein